MSSKAGALANYVIWAGVGDRFLDRRLDVSHFISVCRNLQPFRKFARFKSA